MSKMIPNCMGCEYELEMAFEYSEKGYHLATTKKYAALGVRKHLFIMMVNDNGKIVVR